MAEPKSLSSKTRPRRRRAPASRRVHTPAYAEGTALRNRLPPYEPFSSQQIDAIEAHANHILDEVGVEFRGDEEALALFRKAGARVEGERVRFDPGVAAQLCSSAPAQFEMYGRDGRALTIGGDHIVFLPAYGPPFVTDLEQGRRYATLVDFENIVKLTYATPWLHHSGGTVCEPVDVPVNKRHLDMTYAHLRWSTKPFMGSVTAPERAADSIAMARLVFGQAFMEQHCVIQGNINVNSPLVWDEIMSGALKTYARANQGCVISPFIIGGAMGPVTIAALVAQAHAEAMSGIALSQLVRRGSPVVYGNFLTTMNLRSGAPTFGTAESTLATYAVGQLARRLGLPLRCGGHYTASKIPDGQAMQESSDAMSAGILAGANYVIHSAGWLEGGLSFGYEKFMMDIDRCAMLHKQLSGLSVNAEQLAMDAYREAGPGNTFLSTRHTLRHYASANHESLLADTNSFEQWSDDGALDMQQRAAGHWRSVLDNYEPPPIDDAVDRELRAFIDERRDASADAWH